MSGVTWQAGHDNACAQRVYGPESNVVECAADVLRLLGHNMPPMQEVVE